MSGGQHTQAGAIDEESSSLGTARHAPQKLKHVSTQSLQWQGHYKSFESSCFGLASELALATYKVSCLQYMDTWHSQLH